MKLVHKALTPCISAICAIALLSRAAIAQDAEQIRTAHYQYTKGFKPAQTNLTEIFLQLAGSLEHHGSPEPYIRHIQAEHKRISALYEQKTGDSHKGRMPSYMTEEYLNRFIANWNALSPKLGLDQLAKDAARCARNAIQGPQDTGTFVIEILNHHQEEVVSTMKGKSQNGTFERLRATLATELEFTPGTKALPDSATLVEREKALTETERKEYTALLKHERFTKAEFGTLERFYKSAYDKLTEGGKAEISKRVWSGTRKEPPPPNTRTDAISSVKAFMDEKSKLFGKIDAAVSADQAKLLQEVIDGAFLDLARLAHSELEGGILEWSLNH